MCNGTKTPAAMVTMARRPSTMHSGVREADLRTGASRKTMGTNQMN